MIAKDSTTKVEQLNDAIEIGMIATPLCCSDEISSWLAYSRRFTIALSTPSEDRLRQRHRMHRMGRAQPF
jgi:hypothetical protein